jgi:hypothetical protein
MANETIAQASIANSQWIEGAVAAAIPGPGVLREFPVPLTSLILAANAPIGAVGSGIAGIGTIELGTTDLMGLAWDDTADSSDTVTAMFNTGHDYNEEVDELEFRFLARLRGSTANANLTLNAAATKFGPGDAAASAFTAAQGFILGPGLTTATTYASFTECVLRLSGEGVKRNTEISVVLAPNEALGSANQLEVLNPRFVANKHLGFAPVGTERDFWEARKALQVDS